MKFMKKLIVTILFIIIIVISAIVYMGYNMYQNAITNQSIANRIEEIRSDENYICFDDIPDAFKHAIVAVEDHRFYTHSGIDIITTTRSMLENIKEKDIVAGRKHDYTTTSEGFSILPKSNDLLEKLLNFLLHLI